MEPKQDLTAQARQLHKAIRLLQTRVLLKKVPKNSLSGRAARDLTLPQLTTILVVRDAGEMSLKELAEATGVSAPSASAMVERLVEYGVVAREGCETDRREVRISVTENGREVVESLESGLLNALVDLLEKLGPDLAQQWCEVYAHIQEIIEIEDEHSNRVAEANVQEVK